MASLFSALLQNVIAFKYAFLRGQVLAESGGASLLLTFACLGKDKLLMDPLKLSLFNLSKWSKHKQYLKVRSLASSSGTAPDISAESGKEPFSKPDSVWSSRSFLMPWFIYLTETWAFFFTQVAQFQQRNERRWVISEGTAGGPSAAITASTTETQRFGFSAFVHISVLPAVQC